MMTLSNGNISALLALCEGNSPSPVNSRHIGQWRGSLMFSLICTWINGWVNNREAGDLRRHRTHYDVTVMHLTVPSADTILITKLNLFEVSLPIVIGYNLSVTQRRHPKWPMKTQDMPKNKWPFKRHAKWAPCSTNLQGKVMQLIWISLHKSSSRLILRRGNPYNSPVMTAMTFPGQPRTWISITKAEWLYQWKIYRLWKRASPRAAFFSERNTPILISQTLNFCKIQTTHIRPHVPINLLITQMSALLQLHLHAKTFARRNIPVWEFGRLLLVVYVIWVLNPDERDHSKMLGLSMKKPCRPLYSHMVRYFDIKMHHFQVSDPNAATRWWPPLMPHTEE